MTVDEIELVLLRTLIERKSTCREAAIKIAERIENEEQHLPSFREMRGILKSEN